MSESLFDPLTSEALRLVAAARTGDLSLLLIGSTAVVLRCVNAREFLSRNRVSPRDIDLVSLSSSRQLVQDFLYKHGYRSPEGGTSSPYMDRDIYLRSNGGPRSIKLEVFFDELKLVHRVDLREDFGKNFPTVTLETLLMSKLQMRSLSVFDVIHLSALLIQWHIEYESDPSEGYAKIVACTERDYRCWRDFRISLSRTRPDIIGGSILISSDEQQHIEKARLILSSALELSPRTIFWWIGKMKAALGIEPVEPEEMEIL